MDLPLPIQLKNFSTNQIDYFWEEEPDRAAFKRVMIESFHFCYRNLSQEVLQIDTDTKTWISSHFTDELIDQFKLPQTPYRLVSAKKDSVPIGYALFDLSLYPEQVYICELAVDPQFQGKGIGKELVFSLLRMLPRIKKLLLITRKANLQANGFYQKIGFSSSSFIEKGYSPDLYTGYQYVLVPPESHP